MLLVVGLATVNGPFGTYETLTLGERFSFWGLVLPVVSFFTFFFVDFALGGPYLRKLHPVFRIAIGAGLAGLPGAVWLMSVAMLMRDYEFTAGGLWYRWGTISVLSFAIGVVQHYLTTPVTPKPEFAEEDTVVEEEPPLFVRNLSPNVGQDIISITTEDHYLNVVTSEGSDRILKRMSDAIAELNGYPGMQIHRSHWVALDAIAHVEKDGRKYRVVLKNGQDFPVSRPNVPDLTEALEKRA